ncbi:MAG: rhamnulokinase [Planctomycetota bacterium]
MKQQNQYIAVDLGAESGRVMLGTLSSDKLNLREVYRFSNEPVKEATTLKWDFDRLFSQVKTGIAKTIKQIDSEVSGIGVDSWGVDYGLIGDNGRLLENPYHYRDGRTDGILEKAFELISKNDIYQNTGVQFMQINTAYQLLSTRLTNPDLLAKAKRLLFMADLVSYYLCGRAYAEYTLASTSQLMNMQNGQWSKEIFKNLGLPIQIMPEVVKPGTIVGRLKSQLSKELGCSPINVIAVGSHDTANAVAAVPAKKNHWAYLSSGTWSLMGVEVPDAIISDKTFQYQFTNEGGVENKILLLKNIMGLWVLQQCRKQWQHEGLDLSYADLEALAKKAKPFAAYIDPDYTGFLSPGNMPARVNNYLDQMGQNVIEDKGRMTRAILESLAFKYRSVIQAIEDVTNEPIEILHIVESLAFKYRSVIQAIEDVTNEPIEILHIVGGGIQNELLCQFTANATAKKVITGPIEATAAGNILMQAKAAGQIKSLAELREIVRNSFELKEYKPQEAQLWDEKYKNGYSMLDGHSAELSRSPQKPP